MKHRARSTAADGHDIDGWVNEMIATQGYAQISMHGADPREPGYAFTVGLTDTRAQAELFCMGVAPDIAANLFAIFAEARGDGWLDPSLCEADRADLLDGFTLRLRHVPIHVAAQLAAPVFDRFRAGSRLVQIVLPDRRGRFPDAPDCDPAYRAAQDLDRLLAGVAQ